MANANPSSPEHTQMKPEDLVDNRPKAKTKKVDGRTIVVDEVKNKEHVMERRTFMDTKKA